jgi:hypothetical protein
MSTNQTPAKTPTDAAFKRAVKACLASAGAVNKAAWVVGDNAAKVATVYKEASKLQDFSDAIGLPYKTVMDYRRVAAAWPASDRSESVSWTVHQILMQLANRAELVKRPEGWTTAQARAYVASLKTGDGAGGSGDGDEETKPAEVNPPVVLSRVDKLRAYVARLQAEIMTAMLELAQAEADEAAKLAETPADVQLDTAKAGTAKAGTAKAGTAKAGTAKAGTAEAGTAKAGTAKAGTAKADAGPVIHAFPGIQQHKSDSPRHGCRLCRENGVEPAAPASPRNARRQPVTA